MDETQQPQQQQDAVQFLQADFNQVFEQMRHYDTQLFETIKFQFASYTAIIGAALALYQFGLKEQRDFTLPAIAILAAGLIFGLLLYALTVRHRIYFVHAVRYVNEHRELFLRFKPLGFENKSRMYTNPSQPPFFNKFSTHSWHLYIGALFNSALFAMILFLAPFSHSHPVITSLLSTGLFVLQVWVAVKYLSSREGKSASASVFGKE